MLDRTHRTEPAIERLEIVSYVYNKISIFEPEFIKLINQTVSFGIVQRSNAD